MQDWFNIQKSIASFCHIYRTEAENNIVISTDAEKKHLTKSNTLYDRNFQTDKR